MVPIDTTTCFSSPAGSVIVVGHSHWFRELNRRYSSPAVAQASGLAENKVLNGSCTAVDFDFSATVPQITGVEKMFSWRNNE